MKLAERAVFAVGAVGGAFALAAALLGWAAGLVYPAHWLFFQDTWWGFVGAFVWAIAYIVFTVAFLSAPEK